MTTRFGVNSVSNFSSMRWKRVPTAIFLGAPYSAAYEVFLDLSAYEVFLNLSKVNGDAGGIANNLGGPAHRARASS